MSAFIEFQSVRKNYLQALSSSTSINLQLEKAKIYALLGSSGSGKTTLLRLLAGFLHLDAGKIFLNSQLISSHAYHMRPEKRPIATIFQQATLFPHLNVSENILLGLQRLNSSIREEKLQNLSELFELTTLLKKFPQELSGGEQQRVAIARALALESKVLLLDEPFSHLDTRLSHHLRSVLFEYLHMNQITTLLATHDKEEAFTLADELIIMDKGNILQKGKPKDIYLYPNSLQTAYVLGQINSLRGKDFSAILKESTGLQEDENLLIRPEHLTLMPEESKKSPSLRVNVLQQRFFGAYEELTLFAENTKIYLRQDYSLARERRSFEANSEILIFFQHWTRLREQ